MKTAELVTVQQTARLVQRKIDRLQIAELLALVRLLASYGCVNGDDTPSCRVVTSHKGDLCGPCHAAQLLSEIYE